MIQQIGLFPHKTIGENIATVPHLLGWDKKRTSARVEELLEHRRPARRLPRPLSRASSRAASASASASPARSRRTRR